MSNYEAMWKELGLDLPRHQELLNLLGQFYTDLYLSQPDRPKGMEYFDFVISEVHGLRIQELLKHKKEGGTVIGTFCLYVPEEMILAVDGVCVGLCAGTDFPSADAETVLPRNLCPLIKSAMGFSLAKLCPYIEACDLLVGETTCDGKKKAWEVLAEERPVYIMEVPQKVENRGQGLWLSEIHLLKQKLEEVAGNKMTPESLAEGIRLVNEKRKAIQRLFKLRKHENVPISGKDALLISQIAFYDDVPRFTAKVNELCDELQARIDRGTNLADGAKRLLVAGTPMAVPNWKLHHVIETSGAAIVCEESCIGTRFFTNMVDEPGNDIESQLVAIADRYIHIPCACFTPNDDRVDSVVDYVHEYNADGVIDYTLSFCHDYNVEHHLLQKRLEAEGIPVMHIETDYSMGDVGQLTTRVKAFLETLA